MTARAEAEVFLSTQPAKSFDRKLALAVVLASALIFIVSIPFASVRLAAVPAFVASYQFALATSDFVTAVLLYAQFRTLRSRALLLLACGYLFTAIMAIAHAFTFPGLFAPTGLLSSGSQTTVWLYMVWHGGFPILALFYAFMKDQDGGAKVRGSVRGAIFGSASIVVLASVAFVCLATVGHDYLPVLLSGGRYTTTMIVVVSSVWLLSALAMIVLWLRRPHSTLDLWLMVVMCAWVFDIALSAVLNEARFDLGFYLGRIYGLLAANFVLAVLLFETGALHAQLTSLLQSVRRQAETESRHAELTLHESEELSRQVIDTALDGFIQTNSAGNVTDWNPQAESILGWTREEAVGRSIVEFIRPEADPGPDADDPLKFLRAGEAPIFGRRSEADITDRYGKKLKVELSVTALRRRDGVLFNAFIRDLTEKLATEERFRQAQKMDAAGQLTGGVAHDFNNILTVITGTIELLAEAVEHDPQLVAMTKMIDNAATKGADLTQHLLAFARRQPLQPRATDVNALVIETTKLLRPTLGEQIEIATSFESQSCVALVDPSQLSTALLNLALNARDAMPNGGKLVLETGLVHLDENYASAHSEVTPGAYVLTAVSDTGGGIPAALLGKVFEPFFTSKGPGKGTGLGLSMVYGFVKQSSGHIKIYSEEGHGTTVKIYLPLGKGVASSADAARAAPLTGGAETVLVVEDDTLVRDYVVQQLQSLGYATLFAQNAAEALVLLEREPRIALLFTDVIMPGTMNGRQLADEARRRKPELKVLFTSGYTENAIIHHGRLDAGVHLLAKPYRKLELARMVRRALETADENV